jgi:hypothetical protein
MKGVLPPRPLCPLNKSEANNPKQCVAPARSARIITSPTKPNVSRLLYALYACQSNSRRFCQRENSQLP